MDNISGMGEDVNELYQGRVPILVTDWDDAAHIHFVALAPKGTPYADAMEAVTIAHAAAVEADPEEWNYDDVNDRLRAAGFETFGVHVWDEGRDADADYNGEGEGDDEEEGDEGDHEEAGQAEGEGGPQAGPAA